MRDLKEERIHALEGEVQRISRIAAIPDTVAKLDARIGALESKFHIYDSAFSLDELTGRMSLGSGMSAPTVLTILFAEATELINTNKYDLCEEKIAEMNRIVPDFSGALFLKCQIAQKKGYTEDVIKYGEQLIARLPKDERIKVIYEFVINSKLRRNEKKLAEDLALKMVRSFPNDTNVVESFVKVFGYSPSFLPEKK